MKRFKQFISELVPSALLAGGAAAVSVGVGLIYMPAGVIFGGVAMIGLGVALMLGGGEDE